MENKAQGTWGYAIMLGLTIIVLALALAIPVRDFTRDARNSTVGDTLGMDCENESISNFVKATCVTTDLTIFYFIGSLLIIGGAVIVGRVIFS